MGWIGGITRKVMDRRKKGVERTLGQNAIGQESSKAGIARELNNERRRHIEAQRKRSKARKSGLLRKERSSSIRVRNERDSTMPPHRETAAA